MQKYSKKTGGENLEEGFVKKLPPKIKNPLLANTLFKKDARIILSTWIKLFLIPKFGIKLLFCSKLGCIFIPLKQQKIY